MDSSLPAVNEWHIKPTEFAPVTAPDYRTTNVLRQKAVEQMPMIPAEDVRYPWYPAMMQDSRYVTDYRNHCSANIPVGSQNKTREWMINNATNIIDVSRKRVAERSGYADIYKVARMKEEARVVCDPYQCQRIQNNNSGWSFGDGRPSTVPELFGTYVVEPNLHQQLGKRPRDILTTTYEGGRNTPSHMRIVMKN
jgi:hypothetical protein